MFGKSLRERRCIIPSTGFFEWGQVGEEEENGQLSFSPAKKPKKVKYLFGRPGTEVLYMADIYRQQEGQDYYIILTTEANSWIRDIHDRMPVVLRPDEFDTWLHGRDYPMLFDRAKLQLERRAV